MIGTKQLPDDESVSGNPPPKPPKSRSILWEVLMIFGLTLMLLIPMNMVGGVISERQTTKLETGQEIAQTWGKSQVVTGPILAVPYKVFSPITENGKQKMVQTQNVAYLLPTSYEASDSFILPEIRERGIYQFTIYTSTLNLTGRFNLKTIQELNIPKEHIRWDKAFLLMGISDIKGINRSMALNWQGKSTEWFPGMNGSALLNSGLYAPVSIDPGKDAYDFKMNLSLRGSDSLSLVPIGKKNQLTLSPNWDSPSFIGSTLPTHKQKTKQGYQATWEIPYFARDYGQAFTEGGTMQQRLANSAVGVQLLTPVDAYRQSERAVKYGILFLVLTFATYFLFEIITRHRLHLFQYLLVGLAISLFYLLLIATSEFIPFAWAYGIASLAIISMITLYSQSILGRIRKHAQWIIGGLLTTLYGYLYVLLQLEDASLLFGAIGLFAVLGVMMYVTRNIDWYSPELR